MLAGIDACGIAREHTTINRKYKHKQIRRELADFSETVLITLRKHACSNTLKILPRKNENFQIKNSDIFFLQISAR